MHALSRERPGTVGIERAVVTINELLFRDAVATAERVEELQKTAVSATTLHHSITKPKRVEGTAACLIRDSRSRSLIDGAPNGGQKVDGSCESPAENASGYAPRVVGVCRIGLAVSEKLLIVVARTSEATIQRCGDHEG